jgi:hypothetical protein
MCRLKRHAREAVRWDISLAIVSVRREAAAADALSSALRCTLLQIIKLRSTDSVNPRAVLSRVCPRYRHLL